MKKIITSAKKLLAPAKSSELTESQIQQINKRSLSNTHLAHKLLKRPVKGVESTTFIIPVEEGAITGYFYFSRSGRSMQLTDLRPLIIFYHGGGWVWGNMDLYKSLCTRIAALTNSFVLSVDYRLAPQHKFPTPVEDCYNALVWAAQGARYWKVDPERIFLLGESTGANLAAVVSRLARDRKGPSIAGQILVYPVTDGRMRTASYAQYKDSPTITTKEMTFFISNYQREPKDIFNPNFSPLLSKDHSRLPPTLIITAEYDPLLDDGKLYAEALQSADTPAHYLECKGTVHGFLLFPDAEGFEETQAAILQFVGGRPVDQVELLSLRQLKKRNKRELKVTRKANKTFIAAGVDDE